MPRRQRLPRRSKDVRVGLLTRVSLVTYSVAAAVSKGRLNVIAANNPDSCRIPGADAALTRHGSAPEPHGGRKNDEKQSRELRVGLLARVSLVARGSYSTPTPTPTPPPTPPVVTCGVVEHGGVPLDEHGFLGHAHPSLSQDRATASIYRGKK